MGIYCNKDCLIKTFMANLFLKWYFEPSLLPRMIPFVYFTFSLTLTNYAIMEAVVVYSAISVNWNWNWNTKNNFKERIS